MTALTGALSLTSAAALPAACPRRPPQVSVDDFVKNYMETRAKYHSLELKRQVAERAIWPATQAMM